MTEGDGMNECMFVSLESCKPATPTHTQGRVSEPRSERASKQATRTTSNKTHKQTTSQQHPFYPFIHSSIYLRYFRKHPARRERDHQRSQAPPCRNQKGTTHPPTHPPLSHFRRRLRPNLVDWAQKSKTDRCRSTSGSILAVSQYMKNRGST